MADLTTLQLLAVTVPSFFGGMGRLMDLGGVMGPVLDVSNPWQADARAVWGDWRVVGGDLQAALAAQEGQRS